ncbi:hypothetical protein BLA29_013168, partial [Euroglyphus maynei]
MTLQQQLSMGLQTRNPPMQQQQHRYASQQNVNSSMNAPQQVQIMPQQQSLQFGFNNSQVAPPRIAQQQQQQQQQQPQQQQY